MLNAVMGVVMLSVMALPWVVQQIYEQSYCDVVSNVAKVINRTARIKTPMQENNCFKLPKMSKKINNIYL